MNLSRKIKILNKKLLVLIIVIGVSILWISLVHNEIPSKPNIEKSIDGFVISDSDGDVKQYPLNKLDEISCRDFMRFWHEDFRAVEEHEILIEKYDTCFEETFGGLGNRHPAFLGYYIPDICTNDMIKHLVKHSNMFFADEENFYINFVGLPNSVNEDNYDVCLDELLENRDNEPSWPGR